MSQQYSLRWNNHQPNFISMFTTLLNTQTLVDVTLAAEGQQLQAHKVVLSACSTYFQALFVDNPSRHPIVILKDVTFADLRTMVDFMYYGEVNVTEQQLPKVLDTAKHLKIKGLTEMPDTASLRAQGQPPDFQSPVESTDSLRHSASPSSPVLKRKRRRKSSAGSTSLNMVIGEENKQDDGNPTLDLVRESITLSSVPQQRRIREYHEERNLEHLQQTADPHNLNVDGISLDTSASGMSQGGQWSVMEHTYPRYTNACLGGGIQPEADNMTTEVPKLPRLKLKRQHRVDHDGRVELRRQMSETTPRCAMPTLQKHQSYPKYESKEQRRVRFSGVEEFSMLDQNSTVTSQESSATVREPHTPVVRPGPPLGCNFCWNTIDETGRILRKKTKYHCPECRTSLCIVPCFHQFHEVI